MARTFNRTTKAVLGSLLAASVAVLPATAVAKGGGGNGAVLKRGSCSASSSVKLKLSPENGRIEAELEVDQNRNGVRWTYTLARGGSVIASGAATTRGPSGSFEARKLLSNAAGRDTIRAMARRSGETCTVTATF
jgi:hypothetical protein